MNAGGWANMSIVDRYVQKASQRINLKDFKRVDGH